MVSCDIVAMSPRRTNNGFLSNFDLILPSAVIETCSNLKTGGRACFWAADRKAWTTSELRLHKLHDGSVRISISGTGGGDPTS